MNKLLEIAELGQPVLRNIAMSVDHIDQDTLTLIDDMKFTVDKVNGVGLAAPQVFHSKRIFIIASKPSDRYPSAPLMEPEAIVNPVIRKMSESKIKDWEGCLSIPGIRGYVPRSESIEVEYMNEKGELVQKTFNGFLARVFQHELDHLEGIVFLDRMETSKDLITENEFQKIILSK